MAQNGYDQEVGNQLMKIRLEAGLSQEALANATSTDQSRLSKLERLGPGATSWRSFCRIADLLGYEIEITFRRKITSSQKE